MASYNSILSIYSMFLLDKQCLKSDARLTHLYVTKPKLNVLCNTLLFRVYKDFCGKGMDGWMFMSKDAQYRRGTGGILMHICKEIRKSLKVLFTSAIF